MAWDDDRLEDLKQFIAATVFQAEARLRSDLASKDELLATRADLAALARKMDDGFAGVGQAIESLASDIDQRLNDHGRQLSRLKLKRRAA